MVMIHRATELEGGGRAAGQAPAPAPGDPLSGSLWTYDDLAARWKAPGETEEARRKWVKRRCVRLRVTPMSGFGRGDGARFRPATVQRAEAAAAGEH